eukprot:Lankesteria_metandrocarpae@DN5087_c0_g1_i12.p1
MTFVPQPLPILEIHETASHFLCRAARRKFTVDCPGLRVVLPNITTCDIILLNGPRSCGKSRAMMLLLAQCIAPQWANGFEEPAILVDADYNAGIAVLMLFGELKRRWKSKCNANNGSFKSSAVNPHTCEEEKNKHEGEEYCWNEFFDSAISRLSVIRPADPGDLMTRLSDFASKWDKRCANHLPFVFIDSVSFWRTDRLLRFPSIQRQEGTTTLASDRFQEGQLFSQTVEVSDKSFTSGHRARQWRATEELVKQLTAFAKRRMCTLIMTSRWPLKEDVVGRVYDRSADDLTILKMDQNCCADSPESIRQTIVGFPTNWLRRVLGWRSALNRECKQATGVDDATNIIELCQNIPHTAAHTTAAHTTAAHTTAAHTTAAHTTAAHTTAAHTTAAHTTA